jgi:hypothetical protein
MEATTPAGLKIKVLYIYISNIYKYALIPDSYGIQLLFLMLLSVS